ncbi:hypothetical protein N7494_011026 [Penicillium frequentans]|uniref:Uncharacterized protein n=1 Tax=Penicillium frequentans TaxID=3151616 RepID=A0AAD6G8T2_9EURO|nr:hypothetical protein N7494_011026 [Penicillium glabrum]
MAVPEGESAMDVQMREMREQLALLRKNREFIELQTQLVLEKQRNAEEEKKLQDAKDKLNATRESIVAAQKQTQAVTSAPQDTSSMVAAFIESVRSPNAENPLPVNGHTERATPVKGLNKNGNWVQAGTLPPPGNAFKTPKPSPVNTHQAPKTLPANTPQATPPSPAPSKVIPRYEVWKKKVEQERALAAATAASQNFNGAATAPNGASAPLANQPSGKRPGEGTDMTPFKIQKQNPPTPQVGNQPPQPQISSTSALSGAEKRLEQRLQQLPVEQPNGQIKESVPPTGPRERVRSPPRHPRARSPSRPGRGYSPPRSMRAPSPSRYRARSPSRHRARSHSRPRARSPSRSGRARSPPRGYRPRSPSRRRRTRSPPRERFRSPPASCYASPRRERSPPRAPRERTPPMAPRAHTPAPPKQNQHILLGSPVATAPFQNRQVPPAPAPIQKPQALAVGNPPKPTVPVYGAADWQECRNFTCSIEAHFQKYSTFYHNDETKVETGKLVLAAPLMDRWNAYTMQLPRATWLTFCTFLVELLPPDGTEEECRRTYSSIKQRPTQSVRDFVLIMLRYHKCWTGNNHNRLRHLWDRIVQPLKNHSEKSWKDFEDFHEFVEYLEGVEAFMIAQEIPFGDGMTPKSTRSKSVGPSKRGRGGGERGRGRGKRGRG